MAVLVIRSGPTKTLECRADLCPSPAKPKDTLPGFKIGRNLAASPAVVPGWERQIQPGGCVSWKERRLLETLLLRETRF